MLRKIQIEKQKSDESNLESNSSNHIGYIKSVFKERNGTPRQGSVVPKSRGIITFHNSVNPIGKKKKKKKRNFLKKNERST